MQAWAGRRIGVVTGTAMGPLMPMVLEPLARATGAHFELIPVVNSLFGAVGHHRRTLARHGAAERARTRGGISISRCCPANR